MSGRIRTIKPEWLEDQKIGAASDEARVLSVALILMADDHGNGRASLATIAAGAWQYELERDGGVHAPETLAKASRALRELLRVGFVDLYEVSGQQYFAIRNWKRHQKVDKPSKPRVPGPDQADSAIVSQADSEPRDSLATPSRDSRETLGPDLRSPITDHRPRSACAREGSALSESEPLTTEARVRISFARCHEEVHGVPWPPSQAKASEVRDVARWVDQVSARDGVEAQVVIDRLLKHWTSDEWVERERRPWKHFAKHFASYWKPKPKPIVPSSAQPKGPVTVY